MSATRAKQATDNFYGWERRGRGWYVFDTRVELEPDFVPFFPITPSWTGIDESLKPSIFSRILNFLDSRPPKAAETRSDNPPESILQAFPLTSQEPLESFSISFPKGEKPSKTIDIERFLTMLSSSNNSICFEIVAWNDMIRLQFVCSKSDISHIQSQIRAYFPSVILQNGTAYIDNIVDLDKPVAIIDMGLAEEFMRPMAIIDKLDSDPLTGLYGILDTLQGDEQTVIQVLFKGTENPWAQSIISSVTDNKGESAFTDAPEMPKLAMTKVASPLFAVSMRVVGQEQTFDKASALTIRIANAISKCSQSSTNKLISLNSSYYSTQEHFEDILYRTTHRTGMLLSTQELATFVHYPFSIQAKRLETDIRKTKRAPDIAWGHEFCLGTNRHQDFEGIVTLSTEQRLKHMHVIGATGTGKSTLLQSCIVQDINLGNGIAVLDPHGDLIEGILPYVPEERIKDVIIIDPADAEYPIGFNILTAHSDIEKEILASDLVSVFRRLSTSFGDQMHSVLANPILAFLESSDGGTLLDLRRFLIEKEFRNDFLKTVSDSSVIYYWQKEYPLLKSSSIGPILTRLDSFLRPKLIRNMVAQKKSLDFEAIMDSKKIVLIKLSQGLIGNENSYLLGTFFVSKIYQAAMARQNQSKSERTPFYLYIDEFQNFATPSMSSILSGTRKYGLGCILAHQDMSQLQKDNSELANVVVSNAGTRVCFRIGDIDAKRFADGFSSFEPQDIQNLGVGQAIARIERPQYDFTIDTLVLKPNSKEQAESTTSKVLDHSRKIYGSPRADVEKNLSYKSEFEEKEERLLQKEKVREPVKQEVSTEITQESKQELEILPTEITDGKTVKQLIERKVLTEHRYLQMHIKKSAESRGYVAKVEHPTRNGGSVDVLLEKNGKRIACEIGMTTTSTWELHNIQKCLDEGYETVVAITANDAMTTVIRNQINSHIHPNSLKRVLVCEVKEFLVYLDKAILEEVTNVPRVKGYRVNVEYAPVSDEEMREKQNLITKTLLNPKTKL